MEGLKGTILIGTPQIVVRYKRLETVGSYCNVEVEVQAQVSSLVSRESIEVAMAAVRGAVDDEIVSAKQRKRDQDKAEARKEHDEYGQERKAEQEASERRRAEEAAQERARAEQFWQEIIPPGFTPKEQIDLIGKILDGDSARAPVGYQGSEAFGLSTEEVRAGLRFAKIIYAASPEA